MKTNRLGGFMCELRYRIGEGAWAWLVAFAVAAGTCAAIRVVCVVAFALMGGAR